MSRGRFIALAATISLLIAAVVHAINPGKVYGNISFINTSPAVVSWVTANPVVPYTPPLSSLLPVRLYVPGDTVDSAATQYTPDNTAPDAQTWVAATYEIHPDVDPSGSDLLLGTDSIEFTDGALYRFGSVESIASAAQICSGITPETSNPAGTQCNIGECAALVNLTLRFIGAQEDLDAIKDDPLYPVICTAQAFVEEVAGTGPINLQASSAPGVFDKNDLLNGTAQLSFLVRESAAPVRVVTLCTVSIENGETGFEILQASGLTPFDEETVLPSTSCGQTATPPVVDMTVERKSGKLTGYFDVSDHNEGAGHVYYDIEPSNADYRTDVTGAPAGTPPSSRWEIEGIPEGPHVVMAWVTSNDSKSRLKFPARDGANLPVQIQANQTTDIGATFVSRPVLLQGTLRLFDPGGLTDLSAIRNVPFNFLYPLTSYVLATGDSGVASVPNGGSAIRGDSQGYLMGSYDSAADEAQMHYELLLTGLSPEGGNLDGSDARAAPWDLESTHLALMPRDERHTAKITFAQDIHVIADQATWDGAPLSAPDLGICLGQTGLELHVDPALGSLLQPSASISEVGFYTPTVIGVTPLLDVVASAQGQPRLPADAGPVALVRGNVPQGFQYTFNPRVIFVSASGSSSTSLNLDPIVLPPKGVVACGSSTLACADFQDTGGNYALIAVSVTDSTGFGAPQYCLTPGSSLDLGLDVDSGGLNVANVAYTLDPSSLDLDPTTGQFECQSNPTAVVCGSNCGDSPTYSINLTGLAAGPHVLQACATSPTGCVSRAEYSFYVESQTPGVQCGPDYTVNVEAPTDEVPATDPRIVNNLSGQVVGNCGIDVPVSDDRPGIFPLGDTHVTFTAPGIGSCVTTVTVEQHPPRHIAKLDRMPSGNAHVQVRRTTDGSLVFGFSISGATGPATFAYSQDGTRIGAVFGSVIIIRDADGQGSGTLMFWPDEDVARGQILFRPSDPERFVLLSEPSLGQFRIRLYRDNVTPEIDIVDLPTLATMSEPRMVFSDDGTKLLAGFTVPTVGATGSAALNYEVVVYQWDVSDNDFSNQTVSNVTKNYSPREEIHETLFTPVGYLLVTTRGLSDAVGTMPWINQIPNLDLDVSPNGKVGFLSRGDSGGFRLAYVRNAVSATPTIVDSAATIPLALITGRKPVVAISSDGREAAVAPIDDKILIYRLPNFTSSVYIPVENFIDMEFRPR